MKRFLITINILLMGVCATAQLPYQSVVDKIEAESPIFVSLRSRQTAQQQAAFSGSLFEDPEVEFGYYWGSPSEVGHRWDLSVMQSFEMPSVIAHRNRIRTLLSKEAEMDYHVRRAGLLKEVMGTCNDIIYYRQCVAFYSRCVSRAQQLADIYSKRMSAGDCSILDYNRVMMDLADLQNKMNLAQVDADMAMDNLRVLSGGKLTEFDQDHFDEVVLPSDIQQFIVACRTEGSSSMRNSLKLQQSEAELDLAVSECLPKFQAGYKSENVVGETFRGVAVGVSLPLWSKKNTVKHAACELSAVMDEANAGLLDQHNRIMALYRKAQSMQQTLKTLQEIYDQYDVEELLLKAFNAGELTLESYLQQVEFYHDSRMTILETEKALNDLNVELQSAKL